MISFVRGHADNVEDVIDQGRDRLVTEFKATIADTESLLRSVADATGSEVEVARDRLRERLRDARLALGESESLLRNRAVRATQATEQYVAENPWRTIAGVLAAGFIIGLLIDVRR